MKSPSRSFPECRGLRIFDFTSKLSRRLFGIVQPECWLVDLLHEERNTGNREVARERARGSRARIAGSTGTVPQTSFRHTRAEKVCEIVEFESQYSQVDRDGLPDTRYTHRSRRERRF